MISARKPSVSVPIFHLQYSATELNTAIVYRMTGDVKRRYNSTRRDEQARETRRRIIAAARELFVTQGYGRTTIAQIASHAGVAVETVYANFRNKPELLRQVWYVDF